MNEPVTFPRTFYAVALVVRQRSDPVKCYPRSVMLHVSGNLPLKDDEIKNLAAKQMVLSWDKWAREFAAVDGDGKPVTDRAAFVLTDLHWSAMVVGS
jgi:hypothetical protein